MHRKNISSFQEITPNTPTTNTDGNSTKYSQIQTLQLDRTPIKTSSHESSYVRSNQNKIQTTSPSRHSIHHRSINLADALDSANADAHAPPKPPRRSSSKLVIS